MYVSLTFSDLLHYCKLSSNVVSVLNKLNVSFPVEKLTYLNSTVPANYLLNVSNAKLIMKENKP